MWNCVNGEHFLLRTFASLTYSLFSDGESLKNSKQTIKMVRFRSSRESRGKNIANSAYGDYNDMRWA